MGQAGVAGYWDDPQPLSMNDFHLQRPADLKQGGIITMIMRQYMQYSSDMSSFFSTSVLVLLTKALTKFLYLYTI